jgi:glycosyltransferase 2 family protein
LKNIFGWLTRNHAWQKIGYLVVLGVAFYLILPQIATLENSLQVLKSMSWWAVGLAFISQIASYLGSGFLL